MPAAAVVYFLMAQQQQLQRSLQLAVAAHKAHDLPTAMTHYSEVLAINPSLPAIHNNMAAVQLAQGDKDGAASSWEKAVELKPDYAEAHFNLAVVLSEQGQSSLPRAERHCKLALEHKPEYVQAHHLMGNILASMQQASDATASYERAASLAQQESAGAAAASEAPYRWDGVAVGHTRRLRLAEGRECEMETLAMEPLVLRVTNFLDADECDRLVELAAPRLKASLTMGDTEATERSSSSVFLAAADDALLPVLQRRLAALAQLPLALVQGSEDLQVVHYSTQQSFGMHHDSSAFQPRLLTAFYYLNHVEEGGETTFPAADGAMPPEEAMRITEPDARVGLAVRPSRGSALLFYNHGPDGKIDPAAVHAGSRVRTGEKWGANHWVRVP